MDDFLVASAILKKGSAVALAGGDLRFSAPSKEEYSSNPDRYWKDYSALSDAPRLPHIIQVYIRRLQQLGIIREVITKDVSGSYQKAGCEHVIEMCGNYDASICLSCGTKAYFDDPLGDKKPICRTCKGLIIPSIYYSPDKEALDQALRAASNCNALLLVSLDDCKKYPFSLIVRTAKRCGSKIIGVGSQSKDLTDIFLDGDPQLIFSRLLETT